jgi:hypothetical protein
LRRSWKADTGTGYGGKSKAERGAWQRGRLGGRGRKTAAGKKDVSGMVGHLDGQPLDGQDPRGCDLTAIDQFQAAELPFRPDADRELPPAGWVEARTDEFYHACLPPISAIERRSIGHRSPRLLRPESGI